MATFPTALDSFTRYIDGTTVMEAAELNSMQQALEALEAKVGINNSPVASSHDYKLANYGFVDRGDPSSEDYVATNLTKDGAWHDLDLSSIVPAGTKLILLRVGVVHSTGGQRVRFRKNGISNDMNTGDVWAPNTNPFTADILVCCDGDRKIEYFASSTGTWSTLNVTVGGWWLGDT